MGSLRCALPGLMLLLPVSAWAQSGDSAPVFSLPPGPARPAGPEREGPEIDVPRDTAPPATQPAPATPPPVAPTVTPARPTAAPSRQPTTPSRQEQRQPAPVAPAQPDARPAPPPEAPRPPAATPEPAARPAPAPPQQTVPTPASVQPSEESGTPWLLAGFAALIAILAGFIVLRRPRRDRVEPEAIPKAPPPPRKPAPPAAATPRPRLALILEIRAARLSLIGVTVSYALFVENKGDATAEDILMRGLLLPAGETQQAALAQFYARDAGDALHSVATLAPGETCALSGDLRIGSQALATVQVGTRTALVPLAAFDADYRWEGGAGRTARAFIVGQEQDPPTDRLTPLRLDLGPRQFRDTGCRATALEMTR